jgi:SIT family siderophore-iron:H+ symporter-like MFS transporter
VRGVAAAAAQPTAAKIADVFGRAELLIVSVVFYVVGSIVETFSNGVHSFAAGAVLFQIGWTLVVLLIEIIIADITSLRARLFFSYIPNLPYLINTWVSGNIAAAVLGVTSWRWGIGMFAIIFPILVTPVFVALWMAHRRAKRHADLTDYSTPFQMLGLPKLIVALFWQLDVISIILIMAALGCLLVPFTIVGDTADSWSQPQIVAPLVVGFVLFPVFFFWQTKSPYPMIPYHLVKDRAVWGPLGMAVMINFTWYCQGDYLYTVAVVAFDQSITSATRIASLYTFVSVLTGILAGIAVFYVRRLKPFIFVGTVLYLAAFGLLIHFRGGASPSYVSGLIGAQVLLGIGGGLFPFPAQASIQAATRHEHVAIVTALYLALYNVGGSFGGAVSGAIWRQTLRSALYDNLIPVTTNATAIAEAMYANPFATVYEYPIGTPERDAIIMGYRHSQRLLTITGICLCLPLIAFGVCFRNPRLPDTQSIATAEMVDRENLVSDDQGNITRVQSAPRSERSFAKKVTDFLFK